MKRILSLLLAAVLILGAAYFPSVHADEAFRFTRENFPILDGSTSLVPLGQGIASVLLGESREEVSGLINFNRTTQSFRNLREGQCDIVIAAEPKTEVFDEMAHAAFPYLMETIAKEALVFVVNADNPVNSLTSEQLQGIYSGKITNWKEVGGEDLPIVAFQRNPTAGSQVMMEKLVMQGTPMMDAPATMIPREMSGLIDAVRGYDNSANAIGYTVYYYATDMQMAQGLKILAVDGVLPSADTIRSGEYPYINGYYCCISANEPDDSPARKLYDWLVSDAGQQLLNLEGYVAVSVPGEAETDGADIVTDYSGYSPNGGTQATYTLFDCPHDRLEASDDYGLLYAYKGPDLYGSWENDSTYDYWAGNLMGFYNHNGQLITDPIYTSIDALRYDDWSLWIVTDQNGKSGFVSKDGSFVSELSYSSIYPVGDLLLCIRDYDDVAFDLFDRDLRLAATQEQFTFDGITYIPDTHALGLTCCYQTNDMGESDYILIDEDHNILMRSDSYMTLDSNGLIFSYDQDWHVKLYHADLSPVDNTETDGRCDIFALNSTFYRVAGVSTNVVIDRNGSLFAWDFDDAYGTNDDCIRIVRDGKAAFYDARGRQLYSDIDDSWTYLGGDVFYEDTQNGIVLHKMTGNKTLSFTNGSYAYPCGELYVVSVNEDSRWITKAVDKDLNLLPQSFGELITLEDPFTGEEYLLAYDAYGFSGEQRLLTPDAGTELFRANGNIGIEDGFLTVTDDWAFTCYDKDGNVVFCYPYFGMGSGD